jgi:hypothetical protein
LLLKLNELPTLTTNGQSTNALFFADDGALHAKSVAIVQPFSMSVTDGV